MPYILLEKLEVELFYKRNNITHYKNSKIDSESMQIVTINIQYSIVEIKNIKYRSNLLSTQISAQKGWSYYFIEEPRINLHF